ncbi:MAG: class I SAM-dependent methyltransferase [Candidatus Peregrinibacteria bacterium]|nr:class I SAM-dependent methyltransferase [Candidatus Peregrinibacteria bacterium]
MGLLDTLGLTTKITRSRLKEFLKRYRSDAKTLDVGCGSAVYGDFFPNRVTLDIEARPGVQVDIVGDAHDMKQVEDGSFEVVLCTEVLEHLHTPPKAIAEFRRVLKPGGLLILTTRFIFPIHDAPGDYFRYTKYGLRHLLQDFEIVELTEETNTMETLAVLYQRIGFQCETLGFRPFKFFWFLKAKLLMLFSWILTREYGDIRHRQREKYILSSGYYVAARKK